MSFVSHWPLAGLRLTTPRLELRLPNLDQLVALASLAADGVHDPAVQPFTVAWTDVPPEQRAQSVLQYHWRCWGAWKPENWELNLVVLRDGVVVGTQAVGARDFGIRREVGTGSWLGRAYHGHGLGLRCAQRFCTWPSLDSVHNRPSPGRTQTTRPRWGYRANSATAT